MTRANVTKQEHDEDVDWPDENWRLETLSNQQEHKIIFEVLKSQHKKNNLEGLKSPTHNNFQLRKLNCLVFVILSYFRQLLRYCQVL